MHIKHRTSMKFMMESCWHQIDDIKMDFLISCKVLVYDWS